MHPSNSSKTAFYNRQLLEAVKSGKEILGKSAVACGASPDLFDLDGTPLTHVCASKSMLALLKDMIKKGADLTLKDKHDNTLARYCVKNGMPHALDILAQNPSVLQESDENGDTLLHHALARCKQSKGHIQCAVMLLKCDLSPEMRNHRGETPAHHAARYGGPHAIDLIKDLTNFSGARDLDGHHPIHAAVLGIDNDEAVKKLLFELKAEPNCRDKDGRTPLHLIALKSKSRTSDLAIAASLIRSGANLWLQDKDGFSPYEYAKDALLHRREIDSRLIELLRPQGKMPDNCAFVPEVKTKGKK